MSNTRAIRSLLFAAAVAIFWLGAPAYAAAPQVFNTVPASRTAGSATFPITVNGSGFVTGAQVAFNGVPLDTTFISATQLQATVPAALAANAGVFPVTATNPDPGGGTSAPCTFTFTNPVPILTGISPNTVTAGTPFTLTLTGSRFVSTSVVTISGGSLPPITLTPTAVSATQLTVPVKLTVVSLYAVGVSNPLPGGGNSVTQTLTVNNPQVPVTVNFTFLNKLYDATISANIVSCTPVGVQAGDNVTCSAAGATFADANAGVNKTVTATGIVLGGTNASKYALPATTATALATILQRPLTVTAAGNNKPYDGSTSALAIPAITLGALQGSDTASFKETYDNKNAGTAKILTPSGLVIDNNGGNNYTITFVPTNNGSVARRDLTIRAQPNTKDYDRTITAAAVPTVEGLASGDQMGGLTETYDTPNAGTGKLLSVGSGFSVNDGNNGNNYNVFTVGNSNGVINKVAITLTASDASITFGSPIPSLTTSISGPGAAMAAADGITGAPTVAEYPVTFLPLPPIPDAGSYLTSPSKFDPNIKDANYIVTLIPGTLKVNAYSVMTFLTVSPAEVVTGGNTTFTWTLPIATVGGQIPAKSVVFKICPPGTTTPIPSCQDATPAPIILVPFGNGLSGAASPSVTEAPGPYAVLAVPGGVSANFSFNTAIGTLQINSATTLPYNVQCDKTHLYLPQGGLATAICTINSITPAQSNQTIDIACSHVFIVDDSCFANPKKVTVGPNTPPATFTVRFFDDGGASSSSTYALKGCTAGICTAPQQVDVDRVPVSEDSGFTSDGQPLYFVRINPAGKLAPGAFDYNFSLTNRGTQPADFALSIAGRTVECSTGACKAPEDGFYMAGGNPVQVFDGRPGDPGVNDITASETLQFIGDAGQVLTPPLKGGRTLIKKVMVTGTAPAGRKRWVLVNVAGGGAPTAFNYMSVNAGLTFDHTDVSDQEPSDLLISDTPPQTVVLPAHITTQMPTMQGRVSLTLTGSLNATLLTGSRGQAIPGLGGRDYIPGIVTGGTVSVNDPAVGGIPVKFGPSSFIIEESANHTPGVLDVFPTGTGTGILVLAAHAVSTLPDGLTKKFDGTVYGEVTDFPLSPGTTLGSPTLWQALKATPSDTACAGGDTACIPPKPVDGEIWCLKNQACANCTAPSGKCSCELWSVNKVDKDHPDKIYVQEKLKSNGRADYDSNRIYSCECTHN